MRFRVQPRREASLRCLSVPAEVSFSVLGGKTTAATFRAFRVFRGCLKPCVVRTDAQAGERGESSRRKELFFTETECFLREDHGLSPRRGRAALVKGTGALRHEEGQALRYFVQSTKVLSLKYLSGLSKPP